MNNTLLMLREQFGMSQTELARRLHITPATISMIESGKRPLTDRMIHNIANEFGVDEHWLRTGEGEPFPLPPEEDERLLQLLAELTDENTDPRKKRLIATFCQLIMDSSEEDLDALSRIFESLHSALADEKDEG